MSGPVQTATNTGDGSPGTITVTLGANTTAGNCLVVYASSATPSGTGQTVSGITLGGSADNFARAKAAGASGDGNVEIWTDQNCAGGKTSVVVSFTGGGGSNGATVRVEEWAGIALSGAVDVTNGQAHASAGTWSSLSSGTLSQPAELAVGAVCAAGVGASDTITGPASPWTNQAQLNDTNLLCQSRTGWQITNATTALTYSGSFASALAYSAVIVTLRLVTPAPFTPPPRSGRGASGAKRGSARSSAGAAVVPTPAPFSPPQRASKGQHAARGRTAGLSRGAPVVPTPAPFSPPQRASKGQHAARGRTAGLSRGAPVVLRKTLLISLASAAGTDDYGTPYPQGIYAAAGVIQGPEFLGNDWLINSTGAFFYTGTPANGNLAVSVVPGGSTVTDPFGNTAQPGVAVYSGTNYARFGTAELLFADGSNIGSVNGDMHIETGGLNAAIVLNDNTSEIDLDATRVNVNGNNVAGIFGVLDPSGYPLSPSATLGAVIATLNSTIQRLQAIGIFQ